MAGIAGESLRGRARAVWPFVVVPSVALVLRVHTAVASFETYDERNWMFRSTHFWDALTGAHFDGASASLDDARAATMPGVTTMWIGSLGRGVWALGAQLGLWESANPPAYGGTTDFPGSRIGLDVAQIVMAVVTSLLIGLVMLLVAQWAGRVAAAVAGVLLATEPFMVAHGAVLHTDELLTLFGTAGLVATALVVGVPQPTSWAGRPTMAVLAGALFAGALLTKISALMLLPGAGLLGAWAAVRALRTGDDRSVIDALRPLVPVAVWGAVSCSVTFVLLYPALWTSPLGELKLIKRSAQLAEEGQFQYFLGQATDRPSAAYYLVASPFRVTPWLLVAVVVAGIAVWWLRPTRGFGVAVALMAGPPLLILSLADKKFDRYALLLIALAIVLVGVVGAALVDRLGEAAPGRMPRRSALAAAAVGAAVVVHSLVISPWGLAYFNPALGGSDRAERTLLVGWGEGFERAGHLIARLEDGDCNDVTVSGYLFLGAQYRCGGPPADGQVAKYQVVYVAARQSLPGLTANAIVGRQLVAEDEIRGMTYLQIYGPPDGWRES